MSEWISVKERREAFDKFLRKITYTSDANGCWLPSNKKINKKGYIGIKFAGFCKLHRLQYYYKDGIDLFTPQEWMNLNQRKVIRHNCDNQSCCNPEHLEIGTQQDNIFDRVSRERCAANEKNGNVKLSDMDVMFIRHYSGSHLKTEIAKFMGVNISTVIRIINEDSRKMPLPNPPVK